MNQWNLVAEIQVSFSVAFLFRQTIVLSICTALASLLEMSLISENESDFDAGLNVNQPAQ